MMEISAEYIVMYNKRSCCSIEDVAIRVMDSSAVLDNLTIIEKRLLSTFQSIYKWGKCGNMVPVLVPPDVVKILDKVLCDKEIRSEVGITDNKFVFANNGNNGVLYSLII